VATHNKKHTGLVAICHKLADARIFFYCLIWLMILLFVGTIAQKYIGLYQAQHYFFSSFITWFWVVPVPAGYSVMAVIFVSLLCKLIFKSPWNAKNVGNIITHIGALLLLLGGFLTAAFSYEGNMVIFEGQKAGFISDYNDRELVVLDDAGQVIDIIAANLLSTGHKISSDKLPFTADVVLYCRHCSMRLDPETMSKVLGLRVVDSRLEDEENISGVEIQIKTDDALKTLIIHENLTNFPKVEVHGNEYTFKMRRKQTTVPFEIELVDFEKQVHPGTNKPRAYKSDIIVIDGDVRWPVTISMNEPFRYKGYTLFQASFLVSGETEATVFAVVHNVGRLFPYISSIVMCIGLLLHLFIKMPTLFRKRGGQ
jgi:hypothetical protein